MNTFVGVHGGWAGGYYWDDVAARVEDKGRTSVVIDQLPSVGSDPDALGDLAADVDHVRTMIDGVDGPVTLVGHSYGGMVLTGLADHPAVRHSIYVAAFWPDRGVSAMDMFAGMVPEWAHLRDDGTLCVGDDLEPVRQGLFADVDTARAADIHRRLLPQSVSSLATASTAPDRAHPTTYVVCERDQILPPNAQEAMAQRADHVVRLPSSHCPMLSMPDELTAIIVATLDS